MPQAKIGVIGGSGLYDIEGMTDIEEVNLDTPFGKPSDTISSASWRGWALPSCPGTGRGTASCPPKSRPGPISTP